MGRQTKGAALMAFQVFVDDNFHAYDESERYQLGTYHTLDAAIAACRTLVDRDLAHHYKPGMTPDELYDQYRAFGEDPWIKNTEREIGSPAEVPFSAWEYAKRRSAEICAD
jgi:hypothetical protein